MRPPVGHEEHGKELALRQVAFGMPTSARVASACLFSDDSDT